jgi:hypothetical protein
MAVLPWPSSLIAEELKVESATFRLSRLREHSRDGNGTTFNKNLGPAIYRAAIQTVPLKWGKAEQVMALIEAMEDSLASFYVWNPAMPFPQADPGGVLYAASTPTIHTINGDGKRIRVQGLPPAYVLTRGDGLESVYATPARRQRSVVVDATVVADGSGVTPLFELTPFLRTGLAVDDAVNFIRPKVAMKIVPGTLECRAEQDLTSRVSFETVEQPNENL